MPAVSVIIPCHNGAAFIRDAIDSVLAQDFKDLEVVVADDASSDESPGLVEDYGPPVRLIQVAHRNTQATRNAAIAASDSEHIALLDQDDRWHPRKLARQLEALAVLPAAGLCYTDGRVLAPDGTELIHKHNRLFVPPDHHQGMGALLVRNLMAASSGLLPRSVLESTGPFRPEFHLAGDWDLWLRIAEHHPLTAVPEVLVDYGWHADNESHRKAAMLAESIAVQEQALQRLAEHPLWAADRALAPYRRRAVKKLAARHSELGLLLVREGDPAAARFHHRRALSLRPGQPRGWLRLLRSLV